MTQQAASSTSSRAVATVGCAVKCIWREKQQMCHLGFSFRFEVGYAVLSQSVASRSHQQPFKKSIHVSVFVHLFSCCFFKMSPCKCTLTPCGVVVVCYTALLLLLTTVDGGWCNAASPKAHNSDSDTSVSELTNRQFLHSFAHFL